MSPTTPHPAPLEASSLLEALDPDQREVAEHLEGPLCVLAGARAGQDAQGAFEVLGDLALVGVEGLQEPGCVEGGGVVGGRAHRDQPATRR